MATAQKSEKTEDLIESWVELHYDQTRKVGVETAPESSSTDPAVFYTDSMEKLLIDAQRESATPSRPNSNESSHRSSEACVPQLPPELCRGIGTRQREIHQPAAFPKSPASPNSEWSNEEWRLKQDPGTDWIWDWSSRPELQQSFDNLSEKFRHPGSKVNRTPLSVRNTQVMKKTRLFSWANLPTLLLTHACTFFLGAAAVLLYFKKYCSFSGIAHVALD